MIKIYHNKRCRKSRETLELLNHSGHEIEIIDYQANPPTKNELEAILKHLGIKPLELIRKGEAIFKTEFKGKELSDEEWVEAMLAHPILIERPIVVKGDQAVIGRPPENVKVLL